ncbi:hypothetical protein GGR58DRAFT_486119 [Xylaria digitata]|nr:hypothetical protein GGR58DRAFT_486119 [Xylaria digitata]
MAPTAQEIKQLLEAHIAQDLEAKKGPAGKLTQPGLLTDHFHENVEFKINGQEFHLATHLKGAEKIKAEATSGSLAEIPNVIDYSKPADCQVLEVIGGGPQSEWAAAVLTATATTFSGKSFNHEWVVTFQFDSDGKILHMKTYADTLHIHNILQGN